MKTKYIVLVIALVAIIAGVAYWYVGNQRSASNVASEKQSIQDQQLVRNLVINFGTQLKKVSLLAPTATAATAIDTNYSNYASPDLLAQWKADPSAAPGRLTSSPWPDHILVDSVSEANSSTYNVQGRVIEMTSTGYADQYSTTLAVAWVNDRWLVTNWTDTFSR